jgi:hypothetical protein
MSNVLKVILQATISRQRLVPGGGSPHELGIDRETVGRYLLLAKPAISTPNKGIGRKSQCEALAKAPARALALDRRAIPERR